MAIVNVSKPASPSFANTARVSTAELWNTISTTWAAETRTWGDMVSLFDNISKPTTSITNTSKPS